VCEKNLRASDIGKAIKKILKLATDDEESSLLHDDVNSVIEIWRGRIKEEKKERFDMECENLAMKKSAAEEDYSVADSVSDSQNSELSNTTPQLEVCQPRRFLIKI